MSCSQSFHFVSASRRSVVCRKVCSPFLFCLLLLFLVLAATPFTSSPGRLSSFPLPSSWMTAVSAAPLRPSVFPPSLQAAAACDVCNHMIMNLVVLVARAVELQNRTIVTEMDVEPFMDHLCDAKNVGGVWLRRVGFFVVPDDANNRNSPVHFELRVLKDYTKCKRGCVTAQDICRSLIDAPNFDDIFKRLPILSQQSSLVMDENAVNMLRATVCYKFSVCHDKKKHVNALNSLLNTPGNRIREELEKDTIVWVTPEELDAELTAYATQVKYNVDSFSKEDIRELHAALAEEDRDAASAINEKINSLTTEEFVKLRSLALEQRKDMEEESKRLELEKKKEEFVKQRTEAQKKKDAKEEELRAKREARRERIKQARINGDL